MPKKRQRRKAAPSQPTSSGRGHRTRVIILSAITALATLALLVAGFLSYAPPSH